MSKYEMIDVTVATSIVLEAARTIPKEIETISVNQYAFGRHLAQDILAVEPFPPFPAAVLDGYAFNDQYQSKDGECSDFCVVGHVTAGHTSIIELKEGNQCVYVTTGSKLPKGANTVVGIERTEPIPTSNNGNQEEMIRIHGKFNTGANVRPIGKDISIGMKCLRKCVKLKSAEMGILATLGMSHVNVYKKVKVGVMSTGNELVEVMGSNEDVPLPDGCIRDANRVALLTLLQEFDAEIVDLGSCKDDAVMIKQKIEGGLLRCDVMVTSGGVSMGSADYLKDILQDIGEVRFGRLNMKPGKPTTFATVDTQSHGRKLVFSLPGNPVSCLVTARLLIQPALKCMYGFEVSRCLHSQVSVQISSELKLDPERPEYHRVKVEWCREAKGFIAYSQGPQQSSRLLSLVECNGLLLVPQGRGVVGKGEQLQCMLIGEVSPSTREFQSDMLSKPKSTLYALSYTSSSSSVQTCCILTVSTGENMKDVYSAGAQLASTMIKQAVGLNMDIQVLEMKVLSKPSMQDVQAVITHWVEMLEPVLICVVGGCGLKDSVPEALEPLLNKRADMIAHLLNVNACTDSEVPWVATHRTVVGVSGSGSSSTMVATIPGVTSNTIHADALSNSAKFLLPLIPRIAHVIR